MHELLSDGRHRIKVKIIDIPSNQRKGTIKTQNPKDKTIT